MGEMLLVLLVILALALLWRGPKTLPKLGQALGRSVKNVRQEMESDDPEAPEAPVPPETSDRP